MSAAKQIAQMVEPFLERHPEFALVGRSVVMRPVDHLMRSFFIDRTSGKGYVQPGWSVVTTFAPPPNHLTGAGTSMVRGAGYVADPENQARLLDEMEVVTKEIFETADIQSIPALGWRAEPIFGPGAMAHGMPLLAKGAFDEALPHFAKTLERIDAAVEHRASALKKRRSADSRPARLDAYLLGRLHESQAGFRTLCDLLVAGQVPAIAAQLHEWERMAVRANKVEHLWQPTPFPFELGAGD